MSDSRLWTDAADGDFPIDVGMGNAIRLKAVKSGYLLRHLCKTTGGEDCVHAVRLSQQIASKPGQPLTFVPSISCHCGLHGFIERGRWRRHDQPCEA